jgi:hypothetical protein
MARQITTRTTAPLRSQSPRGLRLALMRALARERHAELAPLADDVRVDRKAGRLVLIFRSLRDVLRAQPRERGDAVA